MATPAIPDPLVWGRAVDVSVFGPISGTLFEVDGISDIQSAQLYNTSMTKDPKKQIDLTTPYGTGIHPLSSLDQLIDYTREAKARAERNRWKFSKRVDDILLWFNQHATGNPHFDFQLLSYFLNWFSSCGRNDSTSTAHHRHSMGWNPGFDFCQSHLVRMDMRMTLTCHVQVAIREIEVSDKIASSILDLLQQIGRWETYLQLWPTTTRLSTVLVELFAQIINFLVRATAHYRRRLHSEFMQSCCPK